VLDGTFTQRPILSRATVVAAAAVAVVAVVAVGALALRGGTRASGLGSGAPAAPVLISAAAAGDSTVRLGWRLTDRVDTYKLLILDGTGNRIAVQPVDGSLNVAQAVGLKPATRYCFQLQAFRGKQSSAPSVPRCVATAKRGSSSGASPSASASPAAGGGPAPNQWIGAVHLHQAEDPISANAGPEAKALRAQGLPAESLNSSNYPGLSYKRETIVVYVGPFESAAEARAACAKVKPRCVLPPAQPGPRVTPSVIPSVQPSVGPTQ
jgi:hypothetical protein